MNHRENYLRKLHKKRREDAAKIKEWAKSGKADELIDMLNVKRNNKPSVDELPF